MAGSVELGSASDGGSEDRQQCLQPTSRPQCLSEPSRPQCLSEPSRLKSLSYSSTSLWTTLLLAMMLVPSCLSAWAGSIPAVHTQTELKDPRYPYINAMANVNTTGKLFVKLDTLSIDYVVPISEIEETIDFLSLKVSTMRYASNLEKLKPVTMKTADLTYTVFQTPLSLHMAATVCSNFNLRPMSITDLPNKFRTPFSVYNLIFHFEIVTTEGRLTCIMKGVAIPEQRCLDEIQYSTTTDPLFPVQQELKEYIVKNMTAKSVYITLERERFRLTASPYGLSACVGEISINTSDNMKRLHDHFFSKTIEIFGHIFDVIELTAYRLSDTLLTIAAEESSPFLLLANVTDLDHEIIDLIPSMLPNIAHTSTEPSSFELFFQQNVNSTEDKFLARLKVTQTEIMSLPSRQKIILYTSLMQFKISVQKRLLALAGAILNSTTEVINLPNTFLFMPDQSAYSFKSFVLNLLQFTSEDILAEFFLIIHNQKNTLYQNIAGMLNIRHVPNHLSRAKLSILSRQKEKSLDKVVAVAGIKRPTSKPKSVNLKVKMLAYSTGDAPQWLAAVDKHLGRSKRNIQQRYKRRRRNILQRNKRSWGGFWGSAFSLATQEDMNKALAHEMEIGDNEIKIADSLYNVTVTNSQIISSLKTLTKGVGKLVSEEQTIFDQIDTIMVSEERYLEELNDLISMVDKTTTLISDYQMIQLQINLLIHLTEKVKTLIASILTHTVDVTQIPLSIFKPHLQDNLKTTLRLANYKLKQTITGTILNIEFPVLSNPFYMYTFDVLPFLMKDTWYQSVPPPNIALNAINEIVDTDSTIPRCTKIHDDYACEAKYVKIYKFEGLLKESLKVKEDYRTNGRLLCAVLTLREIMSTVPDEKMPCGLQILKKAPERQDYIIKGDKLVIASPFNDTLTSDCKMKKDNIIKPLSEGLSTVKIDTNCQYETSQLVILHIPKVDRLDVITEFEEINTVNALSALDALLEQNYPTVGNMTIMREQLRKYNESVIANKITVQDLRKTLSTVDKLHQVAEFDPTGLDFDEPLATSNVVTIIFWILVFIVISIIVYGSYKKCPTKCTNCLVVPFIVLKHMCCVCFQVVQQARTAAYSATPKDEIEMQGQTNIPTAPTEAGNSPTNSNIVRNYHFQEEQFYKLNPIALQWSIMSSAYEALSIQTAIAVSDSGFKRVRYDTANYVVTDMEMNRLDYVPKPPAQLIEKYETALKTAPSTPTFTDNEGTIRHKKYMFLTYLPTTNTWLNTQTNQQVTGLASPAEYQTATRY